VVGSATNSPNWLADSAETYTRHQEPQKENESGFVKKHSNDLYGYVSSECI